MQKIQKAAAILRNLNLDNKVSMTAIGAKISTIDFCAAIIPNVFRATVKSFKSIDLCLRMCYT